jgi:hypothetical protein
VTSPDYKLSLSLPEFGLREPDNKELGPRPIVADRLLFQSLTSKKGRADDANLCDGLISTIMANTLVSD